LAISDQSRPPAAGIGLISTAAGAIFRQFLESKRKKALLRALQANHSTVESYARLLEEATLIAADMAWREYDAKATLKLNAIGDAAGSGEGTITEDLQQLIKLNQDQLAHLEALKALRDAFAALPASHAGLIQALQDPKSGTEAIDLVLQQSRRLEVQYQRSLSDVYLASAQSMAQKAEVQASLAATRASSAEAKAALAKEKAILARSQANLDPSDAQKQAAAQEAETNAQQLQTVAEQLRQTATEAQESAEAAQEVVQRLQEQAQSSGTSQ
ncbi:MAG TPA: hypothetical protein VLV83_23435, partial [Acidobacteriota bacterium]|nr:hypothetical protein [Acidobacteriota bacterium]